MTATRSNISADQILQAHDQALALPVILSGVLDTKIAELKAEQAKLAESQKTAATLAEAEKIKTDALVFQTQAHKEFADSQKMSTEMERAAKVKYDEAVTRELETKRAADALATERAAHEKDKTATFAANRATGQEFAQLADDLAKRKKDLDTREAQIKTDRADLNRRLDSLKVAV